MYSTAPRTPGLLTPPVLVPNLLLLYMKEYSEQASFLMPCRLRLAVVSAVRQADRKRDPAFQRVH